MLDLRKIEIRKKAEELRNKFNINGYGITDLFKECERLGVKLIRYPLGENGNLGFTTKRDRDFIIFTNSSSRLARELFTLAHELGHYSLHMTDAKSFVDDAASIVYTNDSDVEQEANYFAVCLLMPKDEVQKFVELEFNGNKPNSAMDIARLMSAFNVSFEMALNTLENYSVISSGEKLILDNQKNQSRVSNLLKSVGGNAKLNEVSGTISIPFEYIDYAISNYNNKAIPLETLERVLACYELSIEDISDRIKSFSSEEDDYDLSEIIGGLDD